MREILFRGKRTDNHQWVEGFYIVDDMENPNPYIVNGRGKYRVAHKSVGQYTGLKDKNGKRIFEGDVVSFEDAVADYEGYHDDVFINHGVVSIFPYGGVSFSNRKTVEMDDLYDTDDSIDAEVIGNIHDNPDLLKEEDK